MNLLASHVVLLAIVAVSILLMLIRPRGLPEVWWVGSGALLLVLLRLVPLQLAGHAVAEGLDVYLFLIGMMLLSGLADTFGVFDWVAAAAVRAAHGSRSRLFLLLYAIGTVTTVFLSNDATAVVLTPAILVAIRKAKVPPLPYVFACALIANAASFVLPISNPANLVVFREGMPSLGRWLVAFGLASLLSIAVTFLVLRFYFRTDFGGEMDSDVKTVALSREGKMVLGGVALTVLALLAASLLHAKLGWPTCVAAVVITLAVCVFARKNPITIAGGISWATLALVAGLFVLVDAVISIGALRWTQTALHAVEALPPLPSALVTGFTVGFANNLVNNLPAGLIVGATIDAAHVHGLLVHAVLLGIDLGPNLSVTGSLATILWLLALRKEDVQVSFFDFLKVGALAMPAALACAICGAWLTEAAIKMF